jgi:HEAT repeat protein
MGLFDLLSKDKRDERARSKNIQQAVNKYAQSLDRMKALEALADDGSEEALYGLLKRFGMMYDKSIEDEQEKEWVFDTLVTKARSAIPPVKKYLFSAESISWPLRVLDKIALNVDEEIAILQEVLERHEPGYERDPTKKIQLLTHLGGLKHAKAAELCAPYLKDMDEGVRYAAAEAVMKQKNEAVGREPLLELFTSDDEESLRLRLKIADGFAELGWLVQGFRPGVEKKLPDNFALDREGHIKRKTTT